MSDSGEWSKSSGCIVRFDQRGRGEVFLEGPQPFPNGLALSADERYLFVAQSHTDDVLRVEIRNDGAADIAKSTPVDWKGFPMGWPSMLKGICT